VIHVGLLTTEQADLIRGVQFAPDSYFNPIQDADGNWIISLEEIQRCSLEWVKELPLIEFKPILQDEIY
jgi:hypothetical protein